MMQKEALSILKLGVNVFLTGEPGAGKTHTINEYIHWLRERGVEPSVTASTGIAATHVGGMTIHSWSGIGIKKNVTDWDIEMIQSREKTAQRIVHTKILIIDEISMLDAETLNSVDRVLRTLRRRPMMEEQSFGGLQVIFVGDFFQLPPVSRDRDVQFAFEGEAWKAANPVVCYLSEQHRQEDGAYLDLLNAVRKNEIEDYHYETLKGRMNLDRKTKATRLHTHNVDADRVNDESLAKVDGNSHVFHMTSRGARTLVEALKQNCLSPETLTLKEGARVMFTRNNFDEGYVNGTLGEVVGFAVNGNPIVKTKAGQRIEATQGEWSITDGPKILAQIKQIPLRLAWAITVHKSQGMSLDAAVIDLSQAFEFGQGYVALSRVRSLEGLFLEGFNDRALMLHPTITRQDAIFRAKSDAAEKRISTIERKEREVLEQNFLKAIGAHEPEPIKKKEMADGGKQVGGSGKLAAIREKFPNAGRPWTKEDDDRLTEMFGAETPMKVIAKEFGRKSGAITARLAKLGLIEDDYWAKKNKASN
ncbi:MAG: PIF1 family DEAD/DEAH box helicase [Minisyncoccia bacterium]